MISAWWLLLLIPLALFGGAVLTVTLICAWYDRVSEKGKP